jgi:hypothetical protein
VYYVQKELQSDDGKTYLQIKISTACCKRDYLVEVLADGNYYDIEMCCNVGPGAIAGITEGWKLFKKMGPKAKW